MQVGRVFIFGILVLMEDAGERYSNSKFKWYK
jgi:hypothetical protein